MIPCEGSADVASYWWRYESRWRPTRTKGASVWCYADDAPTAGHPYTPRTYTTEPVPNDLNITVALPEETFDWISGDLIPWVQDEHPPTDDEVTRIITLDGVQLATGPAKLGWRWAVNDKIDDESARDTPYLVDLYGRPSGQRAYDYDAIKANNGYDNLTDAYVAQKGEVLDIVIQNRAGESTGVAEAHPWHAHGNKYWDMGAGTDEFTYDKLHAYRASVKGQPFLRDTSVAYSGPGESYKEDKIPIFDHAGWRLFRIRVENPGAWLIHCHILPHAVMVSHILSTSHHPTPSVGTISQSSIIDHGKKGETDNLLACTTNSTLSSSNQIACCEVEQSLTVTGNASSIDVRPRRTPSYPSIAL